MSVVIEAMECSPNEQRSIFILVKEYALISRNRLFIPVEEDGEQHIYITDKKEDGTVEKKKLYGVRYVPLTDAPSETE